MKRIFAMLLAGLLLFCSLALGEEPGELISQIMQEQIALAGQKDLQGWVDSVLTEAVDGTGGWYLIALRRLEKMGADGAWPGKIAGTDFLQVRAALEEKAKTEEGSITKRERMALTLQALGSQSPFIAETIAAAEGEATLMPLVFALHLMNNDPETYGARRAEMADRIIALQLADGGWAVIGEICDVDCTAMALQALAPLEGKPEVQDSIQRGVQVLSAVQQENGGFLGMGMESAESCAQALLALSCLGIDGTKDERFVKPSGSVLEAMLRFRLPGEGFAHSLGAGRNDTATVQCFYALVGLENGRAGGSPYYVFDFQAPRASVASWAKRVPLRAWLLAGAALLVAVGWFLAAARRKRNWRSYAFPLLIGLTLAAVIIGTEIQTPEGYYSTTRRAEADRNLETRISIRCDSIAGENEYAPADGILLAETIIPMAEGETAFDQLLEATRGARIQMEYDGTAAGAYVRGIGYLYEYAFGNLSGWMYKVNGEFADVGSTQYRLQAGDLVEWVYTRNLGKDQ